MTMYVIPEPADWTFERAGVRGKAFPTDGLTENAGFLIIETETRHETAIIEHESDFIYYIISGSGTFEIDETTVSCNGGDLVVVPHGKKFTYQGQLRMLLISTPIWSAEQEEVISLGLGRSAAARKSPCKVRRGDDSATGVSGGTGQGARTPASGSRMIPDMKLGAAALGLPGRTLTVISRTERPRTNPRLV